jgi:hypothetical protein
MSFQLVCVVRGCHGLLGRSKPPSSPTLDADTFSKFFEEKVVKIRNSTAGSPPPVFAELPGDATFASFAAVSADDVISAIGRLPNKSSAVDPLPTFLLRSVADILAPYIAELFNRSLSAGRFPIAYKHAVITPIVKKAGMDAEDVSSYRPISNLPVLSKLFERAVAKQLLDYLKSSDLLPVLQSGFRPGHSVETAILRVVADILAALDRGDFAALVLLDLSAAFDTVDHAILLKRMRRSFGISGVAHDWFRSYLSGRTQLVRCGGSTSSVTAVVCGVPQGSVLGPILFVLYTAELVALIQRHGLSPHLYADDTQVYGTCRPSDTVALLGRLSGCMDDIASWMASNRLQLNTGKSELLWCHTSGRTCSTAPLRVGADVVLPSTVVRDLGLYLDSGLSFNHQIGVTVARCFGALRQLRSVRRYVTAPVFQSLVSALDAPDINTNHHFYS